MCIIVPTTATISSRIHAAAVRSSPRSNERRRGTKTKHILSLKAIKVWNKTSCSCLHLYYHGDRSCKASRPDICLVQRIRCETLSVHLFIYIPPSRSPTNTKRQTTFFKKDISHLVRSLESMTNNHSARASCFLLCTDVVVVVTLVLTLTGRNSFSD